MAGESFIKEDSQINSEFSKMEFSSKNWHWTMIRKLKAF